MEMLVERLIQFAYFAGQAVVVIVGLIIVLGFIFNLLQKNKQKSELEIEDVRKKFEDFEKQIQMQGMSKKARKAQKKALKKEEKAKKKEKKEEKTGKIYVIDFDGDIRANAVDQLREEVSAVLTTATKDDEVVINIESPGGVVHGYGLAAAQLKRVKDRGIKLTACVDKVAASGGYLMACVADRIYAAPFAIVGSIGVLAQIPNIHKLLKKHDIDYREITAGEYKRTLTLMGEITEKGEQKFSEQIHDTHQLFKDFVSENRKDLDISKVATGEYWYGRQAIELGLIDEIMTSDDYLLSLPKEKEILKITFEEKKKWSEKIGLGAAHALREVAGELWNRAEKSRYN